MSKDNLTFFIEDRLSWELSELDDVNVGGIAADLAYGLKNNGYCADPYITYEQALGCPINKRHEKYCGCTNCESYKFCTILREEGYV